MRIGVLAPVGLWLWLLHGWEKLLVRAAGGSGGNEKPLTKTPTWAVAAVCTVFIVISVLLEKILHKLASWLSKKHKRALLEAVEKVKSELMVLGFLSLLLTFGQSYILKICIPKGVAAKMLPCPIAGKNEDENHEAEEPRHRLLWSDRRFLISDVTSSCRKGHEPLISAEGLHQLHLLLFFLAVFHVLYSFVTMMLGRLKIRGWKGWEKETLSHDYEFSTDPSRFRLTHETSFVRAHATSFWTKIPLFFYIGCFFRQFFRSVRKTDYLTLRHGFITTHLTPGHKFDFQKYIKRSLEDDFKLVVGISPVLWASFVIFMLLNVDGWKTVYWSVILPVIIILAVGTKLQAILTKMAIEIMDRHAVVQGIPLVQGSDRYFWFNSPQLMLHLIHFALFQNAFQITYFVWTWYSYRWKSCFHDDYRISSVKLGLGIGALLLCSYITLPLYALVTQMGSRMKRAVFDEQTSKAIKRWHMDAKRKRGKPKDLPTKKLGRAASASKSSASSVHSSGTYLQRFKTFGHSKLPRTYDDQDASDIEAEPLSPMTSNHSLVLEVNPEDGATELSQIHHEGEARDEDDFSFVKPAPG